MKTLKPILYGCIILGLLKLISVDDLEYLLNMMGALVVASGVYIYDKAKE